MHNIIVCPAWCVASVCSFTRKREPHKAMKKDVENDVFLSLSQQGSFVLFCFVLVGSTLPGFSKQLKTFAFVMHAL